MAMLYGLNGDNDVVLWGNKQDVCHLCLREEYNKEKKGGLVEIRRKLEGRLENKKVVKLKQSGAYVVLCLEHIHKIAKDNPLEEEAKNE